MTSVRTIQAILTGQPTVEGAGVHLHRVFGHAHAPQFDPFLLLDDFHSDNPDDYMAGFPWHPHRGIETVTYMLHGAVEHGDSLGNSGVIRDGGIQWMTAGSGIIHQEMPGHADANPLLWGCQLWVNLPASQKMMPPRYQDIPGASVPEVALDNGVTLRVLCGTVGGTSGPVTGIVVDAEYVDVTLPANTRFEHPVKDGYTVLAYLLDGSGTFAPDQRQPLEAGQLALYARQGSALRIATAGAAARFLLISGKPLGEPVAWYGPIVMNTNAELETAFAEYRDGRFLKHAEPEA